MNGSRPSAPTPADSGSEGRRFRLLSCNIQAGIRTSTYREYATGAWKHLVHHDERLRMLARMADSMRGYDLVGLQESDAGSLRTGFVGQTEYLARRAGYRWWGERTNRRVGKLARHSIGAMCRFDPAGVEPLALPGRVPGRGALMLRLFDEGDRGLVVIIVHLALGRASRRKQIDFVAERVRACRHAVVMGDFNAAHAAPEMKSLFSRTDLVEPMDRVNTWPSWNPLHNYDHILATSELTAEPLQVLAEGPSDHLPVALEIELPAECTVDTAQLAFADD
jgi:endonuclease/exonuclease/phosphatase family metal-dependent hydrolase